MSKKIGFSTEKYLEEQKKAILNRVGKFEKLYLEFGGKLFYDGHAARVLPGYRPTAKIELLKLLGDIDIIYCVSAKDIERGKIRGDSGLTYDLQTIKDINDINDFGLSVKNVVITRYEGEASIKKFKRMLKNYNLNVYTNNEIPGYPNDLESVMKGYEKDIRVETDKKLTIVTGAGGNSGKMATCLSQVYNEIRNGVKTGYAKFETFPIWNLDIEHPINVAYEAATADLLDVNMIDPFHLKAYGEKVVNYNRDIENFDILIAIMKKITGEDEPFGYKSPTDMGVNMAEKGILDDKVCAEASRQEIVRRYFRYKKENVEGLETKETLDRMEEIMERVGIKKDIRSVVKPARLASEVAQKDEKKGNKGIFCGAALELPDGQIVTGKNSPFMHAESSVILNAIKILADVPDETHLLSPSVIEGISRLKKEILGGKSESLNLEEALIALSVSSSTSDQADLSIKMLKVLRGCEFHTTHMPSNGDEAGLRKLGLNVTTDAQMNVKI
ncbi:DUF1846 family protein [Candidatus Parcubacteria bacterium]|jgi:uncharacterized protein (UPF0371 family)|nr:DUF1846 family protein [Candidatus Parcubacteria bacterium]